MEKEPKHPIHETLDRFRVSEKEAIKSELEEYAERLRDLSKRREDSRKGFGEREFEFDASDLDELIALEEFLPPESKWNEVTKEDLDSLREVIRLSHLHHELTPEEVQKKKVIRQKFEKKFKEPKNAKE